MPCCDKIPWKSICVFIGEHDEIHPRGLNILPCVLLRKTCIAVIGPTIYANKLGYSSDIADLCCYLYFTVLDIVCCL